MIACLPFEAPQMRFGRLDLFPGVLKVCLQDFPLHVFGEFQGRFPERCRIFWNSIIISNLIIIVYLIIIYLILYLIIIFNYFSFEFPRI